VGLLEPFYQQRQEFLADFTIDLTIAIARQLGIQQTRFHAFFNPASRWDQNRPSDIDLEECRSNPLYQRPFRQGLHRDG